MKMPRDAHGDASSDPSPTALLTRREVLDGIVAGLRADPLILAAWLGGSDAFGRADELSDLDICLIVEDDAVEHAAAAFERTVRALSPIRIAHRLPMPTWHGFNQAFYQLEHAPEHLMVDWVIVERSQKHPWLEVERHGNAIVLFDKEGLLKPAHADRAAIDAAIEKKVADLKVRMAVFSHLPVKLAARGKPVDAAHFYHAIVVRAVVDMLRIVHCPFRWDYGLRYLSDDLPRERYDVVVELCYPQDLGDIPRLVEKARAEFAQALRAWEDHAARTP